MGLNADASGNKDSGGKAEWPHRRLGEIADFTNGKPHESDIVADGSYALITLDSVDIKGQLKNSHRAINVWDESLRAGDIVSVLSDLAHGYLLGLSAVIPADETFVLNQRMGRLRLKQAGNSDFVRLQINKQQEHFRKRGQGTSQRHIYKRDFDALVIPFPPPKEQQAIVKVIADVDALLAGLDRLIAKKRDIKQAAMQQLLTGQARLPGFQGEWEVKRFNDVLVRLNAKASQIQTTDYLTTGAFPVVDQGKVTVVGFSDKADKRFRCPDGGVIVFGDHTCIVKFISFDFLVGADGTQVLQSRDSQCTLFYAFQLQYRGIEPTGYNRHFKFLKEREFIVAPHLEQIAIATILSDMDAELAALEARRDKTRALKQGMMQELLTGRTRLV